MTTPNADLLRPLVAMAGWTFVMWAWLYATRIPAITKLKIVYDPAQPNEAFNAQIPAKVRWKADNYNHLMEQPPIFYAVCLTLAVLGIGGAITTALAWSYVALRVAHSLVQATVNRVMWRFSLFVLGSLVLFALTLRAAWALFGRG